MRVTQHRMASTEAGHVWTVALAIGGANGNIGCARHPEVQDRAILRRNLYHLAVSAQARIMHVVSRSARLGRVRALRQGSGLRVGTLHLSDGGLPRLLTGSDADVDVVSVENHVVRVVELRRCDGNSAGRIQTNVSFRRRQRLASIGVLTRT